jgi:hypothetical protein
MTRNPFMEPEDYLAGYKENIDKLKNQPESIAFDKLCYEVFEAQEIGKKFLEFATNRFLIHSQIAKGNPTYQLDVIWQEGFRDAYRMIINHVQSHKQRIEAGENKNVG